MTIEKSERLIYRIPKWYQVFQLISVQIGITFSIFYYVLNTDTAQKQITQAFGVNFYAISIATSLIIAALFLAIGGKEGLKWIWQLKRLRFDEEKEEDIIQKEKKEE